jgi:hypothetical protein
MLLIEGLQNEKNLDIISFLLRLDHNRRDIKSKIELSSPIIVFRPLAYFLRFYSVVQTFASKIWVQSYKNF